MNYPKYQISASEEMERFEFTSNGKKGAIEKIIYFQKTDNPLLYNLAFGDKIEVNRDGKLFIEINDQAISANGDRDKILATVVDAIYEYTSVYPERWIIFSGIDEKRTRLYRMAITKNYDELSRDFNIFALSVVNDVFVRVNFDSNVQFPGFIIKRKSDL